MGEQVVVRQDSNFGTAVFALDPHAAEGHQHLHPVADVRELTPYGMLLAGLGSCTAIVLHTYAQNHGVDLQEVELRLRYDRVFADDCEQCEGIDRYREQIDEEIVLVGDLTDGERKRLFLISRHCPIHKMLLNGIPVNSALAGAASGEQTQEPSRLRTKERSAE